MKTPGNILIILSAMATLCSCVDRNEDTDYSRRKATPTIIEFSNNGGTMTYEVEMDGEWAIFGSAEWVDISPVSGKGRTIVTFSAPAYNDYWEVRNFEFVLAEGAGQYTYLTVTQRGDSKAVLTVVEGTDIEIDTLGEEKEITIESNTEWEITGMNQWVQVYPRSGKGTSKVYVTVYDNASPNLRTTTLNLSGKGVEAAVTLRIKQDVETAVI